MSRKTKAFRFFQGGFMMILLQISNSFGTMQNEGSGGLCDAAQVIIAIVPLVSVVILGMLTYFFMLWDHQKRLVIIQKGGTPPPRHIDEKLLLLGIVALFIGVGLTVFFAIYNGLNPSLLGGIIPTTSGLGIITYYGIIKRKRD